MAQQLVTEWRDDVDGGAADTTIEFAIDRVTYEIDLNTANAAKMREQFGYWREHARRTGGRAKRGTAAAPKVKATPPQPVETAEPASAGDSVDTAAVREWARKHGFAVKSHGRIAKQIIDAYRAEH